MSNVANERNTVIPGCVVVRDCVYIESSVAALLDDKPDDAPEGVVIYYPPHHSGSPSLSWLFVL